MSTFNKLLGADITIGTNHYVKHPDQRNHHLSHRQARKLDLYDNCAFIDTHNRVIVDCGPAKPSTCFVIRRMDGSKLVCDSQFNPTRYVARGKWNDWRMPSTPRRHRRQDL